MRIAALARKVVTVIPARVGSPPTWDRPDPPTTIRNVRSHYVLHPNPAIHGLKTFLLLRRLLTHLHGRQRIS